jgi:hypothetical protein
MIHIAEGEACSCLFTSRIKCTLNVVNKVARDRQRLSYIGINFTSTVLEVDIFETEYIPQSVLLIVLLLLSLGRVVYPFALIAYKAPSSVIRISCLRSIRIFERFKETLF